MPPYSLREGLVCSHVPLKSRDRFLGVPKNTPPCVATTKRLLDSMARSLRHETEADLLNDVYGVSVVPMKINSTSAVT